jgi:hypothetical protein
MSTAGACDRGDNWVDRAREAISKIAARHGHQVEWTADEPDENRPWRTPWWCARCARCVPPVSAPWNKASRAFWRELILPQDPAQSEHSWLGGETELIPPWLTRKCRGDDPGVSQQD